MKTASDDLSLRLLVRQVMAMRLGLWPEAALSMTRAAVSRLEADVEAGRPLIPLRVAVTDELWRRRAVCAAEVAATLQPGDGLAKFMARLPAPYERVCGHVLPAEKMPQLVNVLVREGILLVTPIATDCGRWTVSPAARKAADGVAHADEGGTAGSSATEPVPGVAVAPAKTRSRAALDSATAMRRALVEADLLAYPADTVAARARRLGPQLGLKDRAARGRISVITRELRAAA